MKVSTVNKKDGCLFNSQATPGLLIIKGKGNLRVAILTYFPCGVSVGMMVLNDFSDGL